MTALQLIVRIRPAWPLRPVVRARCESAIFLVYLGILTATIGRLAAVRPLWYDELFTLHLARVASLPDLLGHLAAGVDLNPPLTYLLTRLSIVCFGEAAWAVRLPAVLGMILGLSCFFAFLRHRLGFWAAILGVTMIVAPVKVWTFFLEARPYGLLFGFSALALLAWQRQWRIALGMAAILSVLTHYYAVLPLAAIGIAELVRWWQLRRVDVRMAFAFAAGAATLLALQPLWSVAPRDFAAGFWAKVAFSRNAVEEAYLSLFEKSAILPLLIAWLVAGVAAVRNREHDTMPLAERLALAGLFLGPVLGVALGAWVTGAYFYRYTLPAVLGIAGVLAVVLRRATSTDPPLIFATLAFIGFGVTGGSKPYREFYHYERQRIVAIHAHLNDHCAGHTVVIESGFDFGRAWHSADGRGYQPAFLADATAAKAINGVDTTERALQLLKRVTPVPAYTADEIASRVRSGEVLFYFGPDTAWTVKALAERGLALEAVSQFQDVPLFKIVIQPHVVPRLLP